MTSLKMLRLDIMAAHVGRYGFTSAGRLGFGIMCSIGPDN